METLQGRLSIFVNGHARQVGATTTLGELAAECRLDPKRLLVELNGQTLLRDEWPGRRPAHGDRIEFVRVVAGG
ncbi:MAG: sulfur carrier protein ThiS [Methylacidiphilales bacterium]|nr:sulfur carrier protein ThiS [Candidatus Methylacidiphilales bacterium]